jgi:hypothetical protein
MEVELGLFIHGRFVLHLLKIYQSIKFVYQCLGEWSSPACAPAIFHNFCHKPHIRRCPCERTIPILAPLLLLGSRLGYQAATRLHIPLTTRPKGSLHGVVPRDAIVGPNLPLRDLELGLVESLIWFT